MKKVLCRFFAVFLCVPVVLAQLKQAPPSAPPDERYKADILVIVGHPDDDIEVAAYLAKMIEEQHKRVAVIYGTRGNSGGNAVGYEQGAALADVREMESRHSLASYGVTHAWFLRGLDSPGGDVLHSLETWGHGAALEEVVRLVRLTRPEVILTWLPDYVVGENHDDHQASSVLANEAFDLAGNPVVFPEQVEAPRNRLTISNYGEGLRPWQPKKIYYFSDATHSEFYNGKGPQYPTNGMSPSKHMPYSKVASDAWSFYQTQNDFTEQQLKEFVETPVRLIFGRSLVGGTATSDVFEGIKDAPVRYTGPRPYQPPARSGVSLELGGPWAFYRQFWQVHNIEHLANLFSPEAGAGPGETLWVPLIVHNDTDTPQQVTLQSSMPAGWTEEPGPMIYPVAAHDSYPISVYVIAPQSHKGTWQKLTWNAQANDSTAGTVTLRVNVVSNGLPQ